MEQGLIRTLSCPGAVLAIDTEQTGVYGFTCLDGKSGMPWFGAALVADGKLVETYDGHIKWDASC